MRDSALKPAASLTAASAARAVGEELMRDSALKPKAVTGNCTGSKSGRRRAHARQRFETLIERTIFRFDERCRRRAHARQRFETVLLRLLRFPGTLVGEELMRDSALKRSSCRQAPGLS